MGRCLPIPQGERPHPEWEGSQNPKYSLDYPHKCLNLCVQGQLNSNRAEESSEAEHEARAFLCVFITTYSSFLLLPSLHCPAGLQMKTLLAQAIQKVPASPSKLHICTEGMRGKKRYHDSAVVLPRTKGARCSQHTARCMEQGGECSRAGRQIREANLCCCPDVGGLLCNCCKVLLPASIPYTQRGFFRVCSRGLVLPHHLARALQQPNGMPSSTTTVKTA